MNMDEFARMNKDFAAGMSEKIGETFPAYSADELKAIYAAYDGLSPEAGVSKMDAIHGQGIYEKIRDNRISDAEIDQFYALGELFWEYGEDMFGDAPGVEQMVNNYIENGRSKEEWKQASDFFDGADMDHNGRITRHEFDPMWEKFERMMAKAAGVSDGDFENWFSDGDRDFVWTMEQSVQDLPFNRYGHHGDGFSKKDFYRLDRILRKVYADIRDDDDDDLLLI
jgi:hypothetical protein